MIMYKSEMPRIVPLWMPPEQDDRYFELLEDWRYRRWANKVILIEKGFVTNFASIPKLFRNIYSPIGILLLASLIHDHGYQYGYIIIEFEIDGKRYTEKLVGNRKFFDDLFERIATISYPRNKKAIAFASACLKIGGFVAWNKCREDQKKWS